jgi:membrane-associated protease RseP (regulator of RpoE activity)
MFLLESLFSSVFSALSNWTNFHLFVRKSYFLFLIQKRKGIKIWDTIFIRGPNVVKGEYKAQFMLKLLFKDLGLALEMAGMDGVPLPIVGLAGQIYAQALVDGKGEEDFSAIAATAEKLSGVKFKK